MFGISRKILLPAGLVIVALALAGFVSGAIGAAFFGSQPLLSQPEIELPAAKLFGPVTNTMLASWVTMLVLALIFLVATRRLNMVPGRFQNLVETVVEMLLGLVEGVIGKEKARSVFPLIATIFLFVMFNAWLGLLPVYGPIHIEIETHSENEIVHLLRNPNTDINFPLAIAIIAFFSIEMWGVRSSGLGKYVSQFINLKAVVRSPFLGVIQLFVGFLEILSHFIRLISFTIRLFGNMTAGEILLLIITFLVPLIAPIMFYGLEILVGFVQALIFAGLTLVFTTIAVTPHAEEEHSGSH